MGRGDKRTRKGKIFRNSYGNTRPHKAGEAKPASKAPARAPKSR